MSHTYEYPKVLPASPEEMARHSAVGSHEETIALKAARERNQIAADQRSALRGIALATAASERDIVSTQSGREASSITEDIMQESARVGRIAVQDQSSGDQAIMVATQNKLHN